MYMGIKLDCCQSTIYSPCPRIFSDCEVAVLMVF